MAKGAKSPGRPPGRPKGSGKPKGPKPGTKPVKPAEAKPGPTQVARQTIPEGTLQKLLRSCSALAKEQASVGGSIREKIGYAKEHDHLNTEVFMLIRKLDKKEPESLLLFLETFEEYLDKSGLSERADAVEKLPLKGGGAAKPNAKAPEASGEANGGGNGVGHAKRAKGDAGEATGDDASVSRPQFGQAPGGPVTMLDDKRPNAKAN